MSKYLTLPEELEKARHFADSILQDPPFHFCLDGKDASGWLITAQRSIDKTERDGKAYTVIQWLQDGLLVTAKIERNLTFPEVEWTIWFENLSDHPTPKISNIRAVDTYIAPEMTLIHPGINHDVVLTHFNGDYYSPDGFEQFEHYLSNDIPKTFRNVGGRSTSTAWPYYRIGSAKQRIIAAVSWQGQWECSFMVNWKQGVKMTAGLEHFNAFLNPGERIRSPLIALMFFESPDDDRSINLWRQWMLNCNTPRSMDGCPLQSINSFGSNTFMYEALHATEENQLGLIDRYIQNRIPFKVWWIDAMWFELGKNEKPNWCHVGSWEVDKKRFPKGFTPLAKRLSEHDAGVMVWFEPERVTPGTWLYETHRDWLLSVPGAETDEVMNGGLETDVNVCIDNSLLLNLAMDEVVDWLIDHVNGLIHDNKISVYRQDFNTSSLRFWLHNDAPGRRGILENKYCQGLFRYWDGILAANPGLLIDTCASGGRRMELETLRRALPIHKTDFGYNDVLHKPAFHHTLYQWIPYFGSSAVTNALPLDTLNLAISFAAWLGMEFDVRDDAFDYAPLREFLDLWQQLNHCLFGDFFPLLPYTRDARQWLAWQFDCTESKDGVLIAIAQGESVFTHAILKPRHIDKTAHYKVYTVRDRSLGEPLSMNGTQLAAGIPVEITQFPQARMIYYIQD